VEKIAANGDGIPVMGSQLPADGGGVGKFKGKDEGDDGAGLRLLLVEGECK